MKLFPVMAARDLGPILPFYTDVLGCEVLSQDPFGAMLRHGDMTLRFGADPNFEPAPRSVLGFLVEDLGAKMAELSGHGLTFERYEQLEQDEDGVWTSPDGGARMAWFLDPAGNILSVVEVSRRGTRSSAGPPAASVAPPRSR